MLPYWLIAGAAGAVAGGLVSKYLSYESEREKEMEIAEIHSGIQELKDMFDSYKQSMENTYKTNDIN